MTKKRSRPSVAAYVEPTAADRIRYEGRYRGLRMHGEEERVELLVQLETERARGPFLPSPGKRTRSAAKRKT